jgi:hypothetical protein
MSFGAFFNVRVEKDALGTAPRSESILSFVRAVASMSRSQSGKKR